MPQRPGNHGFIIPRDRELLRRLYWDEQHSLPSIGVMFDVTHKSVERVFRELNIPRRKRHMKGQSRFQRCVKCSLPVHKIMHAGNGSLYGRLCKNHWNEHRARLAREEKKTPKGAARARYQLRRWYYEGPINPTGEGQWISKSRALLRSVKRHLAKGPTPEAPQSRNVASELAQTLRD